MDASNRERVQESRTELVRLLSEKELKDAALLILANKQVAVISSFFIGHRNCSNKMYHDLVANGRSKHTLKKGDIFLNISHGLCLKL